MQKFNLVQAQVSAQPNAPLSNEDILALQKACAPVGLLSFPPPDVIRKLRQHGYIEIVLGGVQITPAGLERLVSERKRNTTQACR
jgi:hypothetical protein